MPISISFSISRWAYSGPVSSTLKRGRPKPLCMHWRSTVSYTHLVAEDLRGQQLADKEDRAIEDGKYVMEYVN